MRRRSSIRAAFLVLALLSCASESDEAAAARACPGCSLSGGALPRIEVSLGLDSDISHPCCAANVHAAHIRGFDGRRAHRVGKAAASAVEFLSE
jgi:hypothetical protein